MTPKESDMGVDTIEKSIDRLKLKLDTLEEVYSILQDLDDKADVTVVNPGDSSLIEVTVRADQPIAEMQKLADIDRFLQGEAHNSDDIVYNHNSDKFKLNTKFRTDR